MFSRPQQTRLLVAALVLLALTFAPGARADTLYGVASVGPPPAASTLYVIDPSTGVATAIGPVGFDNVGGIDFQPVFNTLYGVGKRTSDGADVLITIDPVSGTGTEVGLLTNVITGGGGGLFDVSFRNQDSRLYLSAIEDPDVFIWTVDTFSGVATSLGDSGQDGSGNGLAFSNEDQLILASSANLAPIDDTTGAGGVTTAITYSGFQGNPVGWPLTAIEHRPKDDTVWVAVNEPSGGGGMGPGASYLAHLDPATGTVTNVGVSATGLTGLAWRPDPQFVQIGRLYGVAQPGGPQAESTLYRVNPGTGQSAPVGPTGFNAVGGIDFSPTSRALYGIGKRMSDDTDVLITINPATGQGTEIGELVNTSPMGFGGLFDLSYRSDSVLFMSSIAANGNVNLSTVNTTTGLATTLGDTLVAGAGNGLAFSETDDLFLASDQDLYQVDDTNGTTTLAEAFGFLGFPTLSNPRLTSLEANPDSFMAYATVNDGSMGAGPTYLAYIETSNGKIIHVGKTAPGMTGLAWLPDRDPCADVIYAAAHSGGANGPSFFYELDPASGSAFIIGPVGFNGVGGLAFQPTSRTLYGIARRTSDGTNVLITINPKTGVGTEVGPLVNTNFSFGGHFDIAFRRSDGVLFLHADDTVGDNSIWTVDTMTGEATFVGKTGINNRGNGIAFTLTNVLYMVDDTGGGTLHTIDQGTGVATAVTATGFQGFPALNNPRINSLGIDPASGTVYAGVNDGNLGNGPNYLATLNPATGVLTHRGQSANGFDGIAFAAGCEDSDGCTVDVCENCQSLLYGAVHSGGASGPSELRLFFPKSGFSLPVGPIGFNDVGGIDFHPDSNVLYGVGKRPSDGTDVLITINPDSGRGVEVGALITTDNLGGEGHFDISFRDVNGALFLTAYDSVGAMTLFRVNIEIGLAVLLGPTGTAGLDNALGWSGNTLYEADEASGGTLYTVSPADGSSTLVGSLTYNGFFSLNNPRPNALDFDPCSSTAAISIDDGSSGSGPNYLASLDPASRRIDFVGTTANGLDALAWRKLKGRGCVNTLTFDDDMDGVCEALDNCPPIPNPSQNAVVFPETIQAVSKTRYEWSTPLPSIVARLTDVSTYAIQSTQAPGVTNFFEVTAPPATGVVRYFLTRIDCVAGTWESGGPGECLTPGVCPGGGRDGALP